MLKNESDIHMKTKTLILNDTNDDNLKYVIKKFIRVFLYMNYENISEIKLLART